MQSDRLSRAIQQSGVADMEDISRFLGAMIEPHEHELMQKLNSP